MKVFGKEIFTKKKIPELYDFAQHGLIGTSAGPISIQPYNTQFTISTGTTSSVPITDEKPKTPKKEKPSVTPKELYRLQALNMPDFGLDCDPAYVEKEASLLERKARLIHGEHSGKVKYGKQELESLAERLRNRLSYPTCHTYFEQFPYTTSETIDKVLSVHDHLRSCRVEEFIPDLPEEAIKVMEEYRVQVMALCNKRPVFYIIADKKDFTKQSKKRDPILLAQSPFGLIWQICGAWDEEMVLLEEL